MTKWLILTSLKWLPKLRKRPALIHIPTTWIFILISIWAPSVGFMTLLTLTNTLTSLMMPSRPVSRWPIQTMVRFSHKSAVEKLATSDWPIIVLHKIHVAMGLPWNRWWIMDQQSNIWITPLTSRWPMNRTRIRARAFHFMIGTRSTKDASLCGQHLNNHEIFQRSRPLVLLAWRMRLNSSVV